MIFNRGRGDCTKDTKISKGPMTCPCSDTDCTTCVGAVHTAMCVETTEH